MQLAFKNRTRFPALQTKAMTESRCLPSPWGRAHWSHWWHWAEQVPDALWCPSTRQRWLCLPGSRSAAKPQRFGTQGPPHGAQELRVVQQCKPSAAPSTRSRLAPTRRPANSDGTKATKALRGPLPSPPVKQDINSQEAPRALEGFFSPLFLRL